MGPLAGVRVIEIAGIGPGPFCGMMLSDMGAEVLCIERGIRPTSPHAPLQRGRTRIALDLKRPEGLQALLALVDRADVVMQNFRLGVAERLGIGYEQIKARRPDIVYGSVSFCGYGGPWERVPGYEPNAQAATGMAARMGGDAGPPGPQPFAPNDYATGLLGAFGIGLATTFLRFRAWRYDWLLAVLSLALLGYVTVRFPTLTAMAGTVSFETMTLAGGTFAGFGPFIRSTARLGEEHTTWSDARLSNGDSLFMELSGCVARYHAPLGRLVHVGRVPEGAREMAGAIPFTTLSAAQASELGPNGKSVPREGAAAATAFAFTSSPSAPSVPTISAASVPSSSRGSRTRRSTSSSRPAVPASPVAT